jgi:NADH-quinone oxidoreductase subunit A
VQFNLRFYVVALVFIIFEVEMAFFFPWATVYGKLTRMAAANVSAAERQQLASELTARPLDATKKTDPKAQAEAASWATIGDEELRRVTIAAMLDIAVFFAVLLVGFAYVWKRGDLDWVRAMPQVPTLARKSTAALPEVAPR